MTNEVNKKRNGSVISLLEHELGKARKSLASAQRNNAQYGYYDDCGDDYRRDYYEAKAVAEYLEKLLPEVRQFKVK